MIFEGRLVKHVLTVIATPRSSKPVLKFIHQHIKWYFNTCPKPFTEPGGYLAWAASFLEQLPSALFNFTPIINNIFTILHSVETGKLVRFHFPVLCMSELADEDGIDPMVLLTHCTQLLSYHELSEANQM